MSDGWITDLELRQPAGISHEVAYAQALDLAERLTREGFDITLRPTLPDIPVGTASPGWDEEPEA